MCLFYRFILAIAVVMAQVPTQAAEEVDPLSLESAPETTPEAISNTKVFVEGAVGSQRYLFDDRDMGRASMDISHTFRFAPHVRGVLSDRVDHLYPTDAGSDSTVNSLREAYVSWQPDGGNTVVELGRINLRYGPAYGYNPTDFFRDGSLRTLTSTNPFAMRDNRLGSVMLRAQRLWVGGSLSVAYSPKLEDHPNPGGWNLDWGATNNRHRGVVELNTQFSPRVSSQILVYKEQDQSATLGVSLTALVSDAAVAYMEGSRGKELNLLSRALALPDTATVRNRFSGGATYTTLGKLSVTAEYQYNGFGVQPSDWDAIENAPDAKIAYLMHAQQYQELVPRQAYLLYLTQKSLWVKDLDWTAFVRVNAQDNSQMYWMEWRNHWPKFDMALQWQQYSGKSGSEYGLMPDSRTVQLLASYYF
jgi:hypothetical protein